jgi:hypothetical protein
VIGDAAGVDCVHVAPSHSHVPGTPVPSTAKSTVRLRVESYAITASPGVVVGTVAGLVALHDVPSHSHVSA